MIPAYRPKALNQSLSGLIEPTAASWVQAPAAARLAYYREAGKLAVAAKREELRRAIGANGRRMKPRKHRRADGANGPVMTPHDADSRAAALLDSRASAAGLTLFWKASRRKGDKHSFGVILGFHAAGKVRGAPVRDVRLSKRAITALRKQMAKWWTAREAAKTRRANAAIESGQKRITAKHKWMAKYFRPKGQGF